MTPELPLNTTSSRTHISHKKKRILLTPNAPSPATYYLSDKIK